MVRSIPHFIHEICGSKKVPHFFTENFHSNATLLDSDGTTSALAPLGSPYVNVRLGRDNDYDHDDVLRPHAARTVLLEFGDPSGGDIDYTTRVLDVTPAP